MASPSPMSGWPAHMYVDEGGKGNIRCLAKGCTHTFKPDEKAQLEMVKHYKDEVMRNKDEYAGNLDTDIRLIHDSILENDIRRLHHSILRLMHKLPTCLVCGAAFTLPDSKLPDSRALFEHNRNAHPDEKDVSTIQGFITHVRKFPSQRTIGKEKGYWEHISRISYQYMMLALKSEHGNLWYQFNQFLGLRDCVKSDSELCEILTVNPIIKDPAIHPPQVPPFEVARCLTIHPGLFLCDRQYDGKTNMLGEKEWLAQQTKFRDLYGRTKI